MNTKRNVGIIGGGASGIFLAICLKRFIPEVNITIYEAQSKIGKKILQTGNGKCNLSNLDISSSKYNSDLVNEILSNFSNETLFNILNDMGLKIRIDEEGRVYPYSEKATTVLDIFLKEINKLNINVLVDTLIKDIKYNNKYFLKSENDEFVCDDLIICTGGKASINYKYNAYDMLNKIGFDITNLNPSLCALKTKENTKHLSGIRVKCCAKIIVDNVVKCKTKGEVLFKDDGLSGIAIFILSQFFDKNKKCVVSLDLYEDMSEEMLNKELYNGFDLKENLIGYFPKMVNQDLINRNKNNIGKEIKNYNFEIIDTYSFENAQVTKGGVKLDNINLKTLESKKYKNMYLAGEVLDIDGTCGGYNLYFAFACGYKIALALKSKYIGE